MSDKIYSIIIDTETCPLDTTVEGVNAKNMWVYDVGWLVIDRQGNVYGERSFVNADIFLDEKELMKSAYYSNKIPKYWEDIKNGKRILATFYNIKKTLLEDIKNFGVTEIFAHNMYFDYSTLNNTQRWLTKSKNRYFFPYGIKVCDTLKMARQVIAPMKSYINFCEDNDYLTKNGKPRLTAEIIYRFISGDNDFKESHTGLEDVQIEKQILMYCLSKHKALKKELWA